MKIRCICLGVSLGFSPAAAWVNRGGSWMGRHRAILASEQEEEDAKGPARLLIVASRLPVVAYRDGEVGERLMSTFYSKGRTAGAAAIAAPEEAGNKLVEAEVKGLYTAMSATSSATGRQPMVWVGWAGLNDASPTEELSLRAELASRDCVPVVLRQDACSAYFDGYCSDVLWPLLHGGTPNLKDHEAQFQAYVEANAAYAAEVLATYEPGDHVLVHDYHLMLVPGLLRVADPSMRIGWVLHVPWPHDLHWRKLPARTQLLESLLAADLLSFQVPSSADYFSKACTRLLGCAPVRPSSPASRGESSSPPTSGRRFTIGPHGTSVVAIPVGIDPQGLAARLLECGPEAALQRMRGLLGISDDSEDDVTANTALDDDVKDNLDEYIKKDTADNSNSHTQGLDSRVPPKRRIVLAVDRLHETKGVPEKLAAMEHFWETHPEEVGHTTLVQVAVPTRSHVPRYADLARQVRESVARINGKFASQQLLEPSRLSVGQRLASTPPVVFLEASLPFRDLAALYALADCLVVSSLADGMNLVAFEFVAAQAIFKADGSPKGALLLSEFAGAAEVIGSKGALLINPYDKVQVSSSLEAALLTMSNEAKEAQHVHALKRVYSSTAANWASSILQELRGFKPKMPPSVLAREASGAKLATPVPVSASVNPSTSLQSDGATQLIAKLPHGEAACSTDVVDETAFPEGSNEDNGIEGPEDATQSESLSPAPSLRRNSALWSNFERFIVPGRKPALFLSLDSLTSAANNVADKNDDSEEGETSSSASSSTKVHLSQSTSTALKAIGDSTLPTAITSMQPLVEARDLLGRAGAKAWVCGSQGLEIEGPLAEDRIVGGGDEEAGLPLAEKVPQVAYRVGDNYKEVVAGAAAALAELLVGIEGVEITSGTAWLKVSYGNVASYERGGVETAINEVLENVAPSLRRVDYRQSRQKKSTEATPSSKQNIPSPSSPQPSESGSSAVAKAATTSGANEIELRPKSEWTAVRALEWIFRRFQALEPDERSDLLPIYISHGNSFDDDDALALVAKLGGIGVLVQRESSADNEILSSSSRSLSSGVLTLKEGELPQFLTRLMEAWQGVESLPLYKGAAQKRASATAPDFQ